MKPPKRRAKRIPNHFDRDGKIVSEGEKTFLSLADRIILEIVLKALDDIEEEQDEILKNYASKLQNQKDC